MSEDRVNALLALMHDVEEGDPLDFGALALDENEARQLVALSMMKMRDDLAAQNLSVEDRELVLMASAGHLVLENLLLHYERLTANGQDAQVVASTLLGRLRNG